jgi:hypothetical protein
MVVRFTPLRFVVPLLCCLGIAPACRSSNGPKGVHPDGSSEATAPVDAPPARLDVQADVPAIEDVGSPDVALDAALDPVTTEAPRPLSDACMRSPEDAAVGGVQYQYLDMIVRGTGLTGWEGDSIYVYTVDFQTRRALGYGTAVIRGGQFELRFPGGYHRFTYQPVMFYLDTDGDGVCNVAAGDVAASFPTNAHNEDAPIKVGVGVAFNWEVDGGALWWGSDPKVCDAMNACH